MKTIEVKSMQKSGTEATRTRLQPFSETIAASDPNIGNSIQLIEFMKVCEYSRLRSYLDLGSRSFTDEGAHWPSG